MKRIASLVVCLFFFPLLLAGQIDPAKVLKMDFAVPDAPAFKALGLSPENILRPGSPRDLGIAVSPFVNKEGRIPNAFALEIAPSLFSRLNIPDYVGNPFLRILNNARISVATGDLNGSDAVAFGYRLTLFDGNDPLLDREYKRAAFAAVRERAGLVDSAAAVTASRLRKEFPDRDETSIMEALAEIGTPERKDETPLVKRAKSLFEDVKLDLAASDMILKDAEAGAAGRLKFLDSTWSRNLLEVGVAHLHASPDSTYKSLMVRRYQLWLTWGIRIGEQGQLILGATGSIDRDGNNRFAKRELQAALRGYYGSNAVKAFLEGDCASRSWISPEYNLLAGGEFRIAEGIWVEASLGVKKVADAAASITKSLNLRYGL